MIEAEAEQVTARANHPAHQRGYTHRAARQSMRRAIERAVAAGTPWVLDQFAVGALAYRTRFCQQILSLKPAAIRGNASEILALAGMSAGGRGVDSTDAARRAR